MDDTDTTFFDEKMIAAWGKVPAIPARQKDAAWKSLVRYLKMNEDDPREVMEIGVAILKFLAQHVPSAILKDVDPGSVPLFSTRRLLEVWYSRTTVDRALKDTMCADIRACRVALRASVQRSASASPLPFRSRAALQELCGGEDGEEEEFEEEEEAEHPPPIESNVRFGSWHRGNQPFVPPPPQAPPTLQSTMGQRITNKTLQRTAARPPGRLARVYDEEDLDAPSCVLRPATLLNVDRWRAYSAMQVYNGLSKYLMDMPKTAATSAFYEVKEFVDSDLPDIVDFVFLLPLDCPQYRVYCRMVDGKLSRIHHKWTIACQGVRMATEVRHESQRHDPDLTDWHRAYHTVCARQQQQGFQPAPQACATGTKAVEGTVNTGNSGKPGKR
jgi:hypothetical protein